MIFTKLDKFKKWPTPRVAVGVALSTPRAKDMPRAALGVDLATPMATLCRGSDRQAGLAGPYTDGPDFWPSAYKRLSGYRVISVVLGCISEYYPVFSVKTLPSPNPLKPSLILISYKPSLR
jgi:hypothetical protein